MKNLWLYVLCVLCPLAVNAALLEEQIERLKGVKLGYYIGSFDPIHRGHQHVIEQALQHVDYVLIYPAPGGDHFKNRSDWALRRQMVSSLYWGHPKVLFTNWTPKELQDAAISAEVVGIIGSDVVMENLMGPDQKLSEKYRSVFMRGIPLTEKHYLDTVGALMALKADSFLVALRGDIDLSHLEGKIYDRPIRAFITSENRSSTEIRNAIQNKQPFEHLLSFPVQAIIKQEGLYGYPSRFNAALQKELLEMKERDQKARIDLKGIEEIDAQNRPRVKAIIGQYGWPGVSLVGLEGASAIWLLVQHQDEDVPFQKQCLELLKKAVDEYEATPQSLAYLTDRVLVHEGRPQIYGTQWTQENGKYRLFPVEDPEHLDARRLAIGLNTIAEYKKQMQEVYHLSDEDFA